LELKKRKISQFYSYKKIPSFSQYFCIKNDTKMSLIPRVYFWLFLYFLKEGKIGAQHRFGPSCNIYIIKWEREMN
jgi:hypothetical protein